METGELWFCYMLRCSDGSLYVGKKLALLQLK